MAKTKIRINNTVAPLMYKGWVIKKRHDLNKLYAINLATDKMINPLFNTWDQLKSVIDAMK